MNGFLRMDVEPTRARMRALGNDASTLASEWAKQTAEIGAAEAGVGSGLLAQAFLPDYRSGADAVRKLADKVPAEMRELADAGLVSADKYEEMDARSAAALGGTR